MQKLIQEIQEIIDNPELKSKLGLQEIEDSDLKPQLKKALENVEQRKYRGFSDEMNHKELLFAIDCIINHKPSEGRK